MISTEPTKWNLKQWFALWKANLKSEQNDITTSVQDEAKQIEQLYMKKKKGKNDVKELEIQ